MVNTVQKHVLNCLYIVFLGVYLYISVYICGHFFFKMCNNGFDENKTLDTLIANLNLFLFINQFTITKFLHFTQRQINQLICNSKIVAFRKKKAKKKIQLIMTC
jgi:hypothetical protein